MLNFTATASSRSGSRRSYDADASERNSSSVTSPRFSAPSAFTSASSSGQRSSGTSRPSRSTGDPDRVDPALLAEHDRRARRRRARTSTARSPAGRGTGSRPRRSRARKRFSPTTGFHGSSSYPETSRTRPRDLAGAVEAEVRRDAVERVERQRDLDQVGVAAALAHPVDRPLHPGRAGADGRRRRRGREAEVVVAVEVDGDRPGRATRACGRRARRPPRAWRSPIVSTTTASFAPASIAVSYACRKNSRSARVPSTPKYATVMPCSRGERDRVADPLRASTRATTPSAASFASEIGDSITLACTPSSTSASASAATAREKPQTSASRPGVGDQLHRVPVVLRDAREAGLDPLDPERRRSRGRARASARGSRTTPTVCSPSRSVVS